MKSGENLTCQSTPELSCANERDKDRNDSRINLDETSPLSTTATILTSTSLTGLTPTSSGTVDDKNEVYCTCSFSSIVFFLSLLITLSWHTSKRRNYQIDDRNASAFASFLLFLLLLRFYLLSIFWVYQNDNTTNTSDLYFYVYIHLNVYLYGMSNVIHIMSNEKTSHSSPPLIRASTPAPNDRSLLSNLTFYTVRRHHSAPQQDCLWQQVEFICFLFIIKRKISH